MSTATSKPLDKSSKINIVGAGVFGLSTAIHLAQREYKNVTIFDKQDYNVSKYSYFRGCDAASADINKIFRTAYGGQTDYRDLSIESMHAWEAWNADIASGNVPAGMSTSDKVFINNGNLSLTDEETLPPFERATISNMNATAHLNSQLITCEPEDVEAAEKRGFGFAIDPFSCRQRGQGYLGVLDTLGGTLMADKACCFALHKAKSLGVRVVFGRESGSLQSFVHSSSAPGEVLGIRTQDGKVHHASLTIMACGGWTPSLIPSLDSVCETTCGSVVIMKIPQTSPLLKRYTAENFPSWTYKMRDGAQGGLYGFAATDEGYMKIGYRGTKYTNPQVQADGRERSVPVTRYTEPKQIRDQIPLQALEVIKHFIHEFLPDLPANGVKIETTRLCWYNDSWDNHLVIDHVPKHRGLFVATAGSGHAFKYLPIIGRWIVDILEDKRLDRRLVKSWRWRGRPEEAQVINSLMEGSEGSRALKNVRLSDAGQLKVEDRAKM